MEITVNLIRFAGGLQLLQSAAIIAGRQGLGWAEEIQRLTPLGRSFVYSIAAGIFIYVTGSGVLIVALAEEVGTSRLGLGLCLLQALAWGVRSIFQWHQMRPVWGQQTRWLHYAMCGVYSSITGAYTLSILGRLL